MIKHQIQGYVIDEINSDITHIGMAANFAIALCIFINIYAFISFINGISELIIRYNSSTEYIELFTIISIMVVLIFGLIVSFYTINKILSLKKAYIRSLIMTRFIVNNEFRIHEEYTTVSE